MLQNLVITDNVAYYFKIRLSLENLRVCGGIWHSKGILQTMKLGDHLFAQQSTIAQIYCIYNTNKM